MTETLQNNPDYLHHHPDAVQDVDRAHRMARAGNHHRSIAARKRNAAEVAFKLSLKGDDHSTVFHNAYDEAMHALEVDPSDKHAQDRYNALARFPNAYDFDGSIERLKHDAAVYDQLAHETESLVDAWDHDFKSQDSNK